MKKNPVYPFVAIVGQEKMKLSLILNVVNPGLSVVLIRGEKGTAKSTAVRAPWPTFFRKSTYTPTTRSCCPRKRKAISISKFLAPWKFPARA